MALRLRQHEKRDKICRNLIIIVNYISINLQLLSLSNILKTIKNKAKAHGTAYLFLKY